MRGAADLGPVLEEGGLRWWLRPGLDVETARPRIAAALAALAAGAPDLKRGRRKGLHRLDLSGDGAPDHLLKTHRYDGGRRGASKARGELALAAALAARGLPAPVPLAAGERREGGRLVACHLLVEILPDVTDLRAALAPGAAIPARRRAAAAAFGGLARRLHEAGLHQDDFQPNNFLVRWRGDDAELFVIDFERARLRARVPERLRRRALAKLDRELGRAPSSLRLRFLHGYEAGDAAAARARFRAVAAEAPRLARRDAGHLLRNATVPGRRFEAVGLAGHHGLARPGLDVERLARALARPPDAGEPIVASEAGWLVGLARPGLGPARRALARALVLAARGLAPRPLALLVGDDDRALLVLERAPGARPAGEVPRHAARDAARAVLERRLALYGRTTRRPGLADLAFERGPEGGLRASLLAVEAFDVRRRWLG